MLENPVLLLAFNAAAQVLVSSLLGTLMLVPMQPWAKGLRGRWNAKALLAMHLDLYMLAFMQWGAAFTMQQWPSTASTIAACLLVFGGWVNPLPYLLRGFGLNAFVFAGGGAQRFAAGVAGMSVLAIIVAWALLLRQLWALA